jgi:hypothetical protein
MGVIRWVPLVWELRVALRFFVGLLGSFVELYVGVALPSLGVFMCIWIQCRNLTGFYWVVEFLHCREVVGGLCRGCTTITPNSRQHQPKFSMTSTTNGTSPASASLGTAASSLLESADILVVSSLLLMDF